MARFLACAGPVVRACVPVHEEEDVDDIVCERVRMKRGEGRIERGRVQSRGGRRCIRLRVGLLRWRGASLERRHDPQEEQTDPPQAQGGPPQRRAGSVQLRIAFFGSQPGRHPGADRIREGTERFAAKAGGFAKGADRVAPGCMPACARCERIGTRVQTGSQ